jgi:hypothetical protein
MFKVQCSVFDVFHFSSFILVHPSAAPKSDLSRWNDMKADEGGWLTIIVY